MSKKGELKRKIGDLEREIEALEKKRARSQFALMTAMLKKEKPDPADEEYFRVFTALIDGARDEMRAAIAELENLKKKKS